MNPEASPKSSAILVVDDDSALVGAISALLKAGGYRVEVAYNGVEAIEVFESTRPELVLLDLAMPGRDGLAVIQEIRTRSATPIIVLTGETDETAKVDALDAGADDYVTKPFGRQELLARVRAALRRSGEPSDGSARDRTIIGAAGLRIDIGRHEVLVGSRLLALTKTEFNILEALASVKGRVVTQQRLLAAAWPNKATPDPLLLKPHVARLRSKLEEAGGPLPESVRGVGYRLGAD
jgi:two-component system response regulator MtrA